MFRSRLDQNLNMEHELLRLAQTIDQAGLKQAFDLTEEESRARIYNAFVEKGSSVQTCRSTCYCDWR